MVGLSPGSKSNQPNNHRKQKTDGRTEYQSYEDLTKLLPTDNIASCGISGLGLKVQSQK